MLPALLAMSLMTPALAQDEGPPAPIQEPKERDAFDADPGAVLAVGSRLAGSVARLDAGWFGVDLMGDISLEARIDERSSLRFEVGFNPVRGRVHVVGAGRVYPMGKERVCWWAEGSIHLQRTGGRARPSNLWVARPARLWFSLPVLYGAGWRIMASETVVIDMGVHGGPVVEIRPDEDLPFGVGAVATGHILFGTAF